MKVLSLLLIAILLCSGCAVTWDKRTKVSINIDDFQGVYGIVGGETENAKVIVDRRSKGIFRSFYFWDLRKTELHNYKK